MDRSAGITRRTLLKRGGLLAFAVFSPLGCGDSNAPTIGVPVDPGMLKFLNEGEFATLRALVDCMIPPDTSVGAAEAGCAEAIDALLGAFGVQPPRIYAGGPYSDRGGATHNDFAEFLPLDPYEELAWRLRIEGSAGHPEREFNGSVKGLQSIYRDGLVALDAAAGAYGADRFADLDPVRRELLLRASSDAAIGELIDVAFPHTLEFMYGAPEYGGNRDLAGWRYTRFDGDVQPLGYTREQVENPDNPGLPGGVLDLPDGVTLAQIAAIAPLASYEAAQGIVQRAQGRLSGWQAGVAELLQGNKTHGT
ncbi:MAG: gluconate 2-dehydrogenase subunit 3 family protein [Pseudomonadota bacterium]|nr:gluconate 2-dehydrogenase subunit 3 family protein [Pseudomonadota bacterium]